MTPAQHRTAIFDHIAENIGKPTPTNQEMATALGVPTRQVNQYIGDLLTEGRIKAPERGKKRIFIIPGVGHTLSRYSAVVAEDEPVRIEQWCCPRCGARSGNCTHTAVTLTTHGRTAWGALA